MQPSYTCHCGFIIAVNEQVCLNCGKERKDLFPYEFVTKDSGQREQYSTGMQRDSAKKTLRPDLIDQAMLRRWAELMGRGADKYGERNWELASTDKELQRFRTSAFRHFFQWFNGEIEEDHAAAVMFNIAGAEMVKNKLQSNRKDADGNNLPF